jgi:DNA replication ATP-dependent helicase Dna2
MMYAAAADVQQPASAKESHKQLKQTFTGHLTTEDFDFFQKWDRLIDLEADSQRFLVAEAWLVDSQQRERDTSKTVAGMVFSLRDSVLGNPTDVGIAALLTFHRNKSSLSNTPIQNLGFGKGCHVVISCDLTVESASLRGRLPAPMHIVRGVLEQASTSSIIIRASNDDFVRMQRIVAAHPELEQALFRLDRDEVVTGITTLRQNLLNLLTADKATDPSTNCVDKSRRLPWLRDLVVRMRSPAFADIAKINIFTPVTSAHGLSEPTLQGCDMMDLALEFAEELNSDQRNAVERVMTATDYTLIQGLPGTGKTKVIAFVARLLAAHGNRVLITSYTNAAVDNVLLKLIESGCKTTDANHLPTMVRVGKQSSCHAGVVSVMASTVANELERSLTHLEGSTFTNPSADCLRRVVAAARIIGATVLSVPRSPLLVDENFDVVIVDEAGQISQPAILGVLMAADNFVLVGDHMQLPPLVNSELADRGGFGVSMLKHLADAHPESVAQLAHQYRMNEDICYLSNDIIYGGALMCANDFVRQQRLSLPGFPENSPLEKFFMRAIDPSMPVAFVNTDLIGKESYENKGCIQQLESMHGRGSGGKTVNETELALVCLIVETLVRCGAAASSIGVISPLRAQVEKLNACPSLSKLKSQGVEISTIDQYQGRDKECIVLSFVRSNVKAKVGRLLEDARRLNVAVSRAKSKLIMVGSFSTLSKGSNSLRPALQRILDQGRVVDVSYDFAKKHLAIYKNC